MSIIITILKIIGIVLLVILGLIVVSLALALFIPARYEIKGEFTSDKKEAFLRITWLLRIVRVLVCYDTSGFETKITAFGVNLKGKKNDGKKSDKQFTKAVDRADCDNKENKEELEKYKKVLEKQDEDSQRLPAYNGASSRKGFFAGLEDRLRSIIEKIKIIFEKICETVKNIREKVGKIKAFITDEANKSVFGNIKNEVFYLLRHFRPRKLQGVVLFGTGDPATTGWILGAFYALYQGIQGRIDVTPDFERKVFEGKLTIKGRIRGIHAVLTAIRLFADKNFRRMIK